MSDLPSVAAVWMAAEGNAPLPEGAFPVVLQHVLQTGRMAVAGVEGRVAGFSASVVRGDVSFLSYLFVDPAMQSAGMGQALLAEVMPHDGTIHATVSSPDPRALGLYVRHGMVTVWPVFGLRADVASLSDLPVSTATVRPADPADLDIVARDAAVSGRSREDDHHHWMHDMGGVAFDLERRGRRVGYGYLQVGSNSADAAFRAGHVRIGPLGIEDEASAFDCVLAAVAFAREFGARLDIMMPGVHPATGALLEAGFRIAEIDTFLTAAGQPLLDGTRYVPSGGGLF